MASSRHRSVHRFARDGVRLQLRCLNNHPHPDYFDANADIVDRLAKLWEAA